MAVLLSAVLVSFGRHARQIRNAHDRIAAVQACDELMADWVRRPSRYDGRTSGRVVGRSDWGWRRIVLSSQATLAMNVDVVRWEIYRLGKNRSAGPVARLDVLMPRPKAGDKEQASVAETR